MIMVGTCNLQGVCSGVMVEALRYMKLARLSAIHTGHFYSQEIFLVLISVRG
jgi:hypothetical protein